MQTRYIDNQEHNVKENNGAELAISNTELQYVGGE